MKYRANPVVVEAHRINAITRLGDDPNTYLDLEGGGAHVATPAQTARMTPELGDYVVTQADGYVYLNPKDVFERKYAPCSSVHLTPREKDLLRELLTGACDKEIASRVGLTLGTIKVYFSKKVFPKLGVSDRVSAALWAARSGLFDE